MNKKQIFPKGTRAEFKIENYLENNLDLIEPGLLLVSRQYKVYYKSQIYIGAIDLFCQGDDGAQVIVELKSKELGARDLGQIMAYYSVCKIRSERNKLLPPRCYCIGSSVGPQYKLGLKLLDDGKHINLCTKTYIISSEINIEDKEFAVTLSNYYQDQEGQLIIKGID